MVDDIRGGLGRGSSTGDVPLFLGSVRLFRREHASPPRHTTAWVCRTIARAHHLRRGRGWHAGVSGGWHANCRVRHSDRWAEPGHWGAKPRPCAWQECDMAWAWYSSAHAVLSYQEWV